MSVSTSYTLTEAREMLHLWKECERALASGTAKAYRVGSREYTALDLAEVRKAIERMSAIIDGLTGSARTSRVVRIVPRDL